MAENSLNSYGPYKIERCTKNPQVIIEGSRIILSRAFIITPEPDIDDPLLHLVSIRNGAAIRKLNKSPGNGMLCSAMIEGGSLEAVARLETGINELGVLLNADKDERYAEIQTP